MPRGSTTEGVRKRRRVAASSSLAEDERKQPTNDDDLNGGTDNAKLARRNVQKKLSTSFGLVCSKLWMLGNLLIGISVMIYVGNYHSWYMSMINENKLWFSNIKEVEREISFRTEAGLYYSYYKQLVNAPSLSDGLHQLINDNRTESWRTINVLKRFNIYQEVFSAFLYRNFGHWLTNLSPIYFYIDSIFALHAMLVCALFLISWQLSGNWTSGVMTAALYSFNRVDTTRVAYTMALRENWSLPFLWLQIALITAFLRSSCRWIQLLTGVGVFLATFLFTLTWQFAQFVLLLESMPIFGLYLLGVLRKQQTQWLLASNALSILLVCLMQFFEQMLFVSVALWFSLFTLAVNQFWLKVDNPFGRSSFLTKLIKILSLSVFSVVCAFTLSTAFRLILNVDSDEHIFQIFNSKLSTKLPTDFAARLYVCIEIFRGMGRDVFERTYTGWLLLPYGVCHSLAVIYLIVVWINDHRTIGSNSDDETDENFSRGTTKSKSPKPQESWNNCCVEIDAGWAFNTTQCVFFMALAILILRMKYLWTPYMCVLAGAGLGCQPFLAWIFQMICELTKSESSSGSNGSKSVVAISCTISLILPLFFTAQLWSTFYQPAVDDLNQLTEFYDPDTVELMEWVVNQVPREAVFSGSMQLLAGVKLCTGNPISNHPHFENKELRDATKELYQYYGRRPAVEVHEVMMRYGVNYIIMEDSICLIPRTDNCRLGDHMDLINGHKLEFGSDEENSKLKNTNVERFCKAVRFGRGDYGRLFQLVLENKTFRVYRVVDVPVRPAS